MTTFKAWRFRRDQSAYRLVCEDTPRRLLEPTEVRIRVAACSLNYRDLIAYRNMAGRNVDGKIPLSDGSGEVVEVGSSVQSFKVGDRVAGCFFTQWHSGRFDLAYHSHDLGGNIDGMLAQEVVLDETSIVAAPESLNHLETATLPCAGVTAWQALYERGNLQSGHSILVLGTGGVSIYALQLGVAMGASVYVTSRSSLKLERAKQLGAVGTIDTTLESDWDKVVWESTGRRGVDHVIEVGGPGTLEKSMKSVAGGGQIHLIGVLTGFGPPTASLFPLLARNVTVNGIYVGSREHFQRLNQFVEKHKIKPTIDRVFDFAQAIEAFEYLESANHLGKVVIDVSHV